MAAISAVTGPWRRFRAPSAMTTWVRGLGASGRAPAWRGSGREPAWQHTQPEGTPPFLLYSSRDGVATRPIPASFGESFASPAGGRYDAAMELIGSGKRQGDETPRETRKTHRGRDRRFRGRDRDGGPCPGHFEVEAFLRRLDRVRQRAEQQCLAR